MVGYGDGMSGMVFAGGICAALLTRERTGTAPVVDASLLGTALWFNAPAIISSVFPPGQQAFSSRPAHETVPWNMNTYRTADGRLLYLSLLGDFQKEWVDLCAHLDRTDLTEDPRFTDAGARLANGAALVAELDAVFAARSYAAWGAALATTKGVWAPVQTAREMHEDPQVRANGFIQDVDYPDGPLALVSPPVLFDEDPGVPGRAPDFGEHTDAVLAEAGYAGEAIRDLRARRVIA